MIELFVHEDCGGSFVKTYAGNGKCTVCGEFARMAELEEELYSQEHLVWALVVLTDEKETTEE